MVQAKIIAIDRAGDLVQLRANSDASKLCPEAIHDCKTTRNPIGQFPALMRIAIVGVSRSPKDYTRAVYAEFQKRGYEIMPVNLPIHVYAGQRLLPSRMACLEDHGQLSCQGLMNQSGLAIALSAGSNSLATRLLYRNS